MNELELKERAKELKADLKLCCEALEICLSALDGSHQVQRTAKNRAEAALARARQWEES